MKIISILLGLGLLLGITAIIKKDDIKYNKITAAEAKAIIDRQEVTILDVRTPEEYKEGHIEGALLIPNYELKNLAGRKLPDKDKKILVYCRSGNRSKSASKLLLEMGYSQVYDFGGIISWPYGTVRGQ